MKRANYDDGMDPECVPICDALNALPGIETFESCCGHGKSAFVVFFTAEHCQQLAPVLDGIASLAERWREWKIVPGGFPRCPRVTFCLEGPVNGADEAMRIASILRDRAPAEEKPNTIEIDDPHFVVFTRDGELETDILVKKGESYRTFAMMVADVVRHIANAFKVDEKFIWLWVDKERYKPTSPALEIKPIPRHHRRDR